MKKLLILAVCLISVLAFVSMAGAWNWNIDGKFKVESYYNQGMYADHWTSAQNGSFNSFSKGDQYTNILVSGSLLDSQFPIKGGYQGVIKQFQGSSQHFDIPSGNAYNFSEAKSITSLNLGQSPPNLD